MKKTEIDYFRNRISEAVNCTNGDISTRLNKFIKKSSLTEPQKIQLIREGKATLRPDYELVNSRTYKDSLAEALCKAYTFDHLTDDQKEAEEAYNKTVNNKKQDLHTEVELEGKRLLDRMVLGMVTPEQVPDELKRLGEMVSLAVM